MSAAQIRLGLEGFATKDLREGTDGSANIALKRQPAGFVVDAHYHTQPQFQVVLDGKVTFSDHGELPAIGVHYTDARHPYGPFTVGPEMLMLIVRPRRAGIIQLAHPRAPEGIRDGRELVGRAPRPHALDVAGRVRIAGSEDSVHADLITVPAGDSVALRAVPRRTCHVVVAEAMSHRRMVTSGSFRITSSYAARSTVWLESGRAPTTERLVRRCVRPHASKLAMRVRPVTCSGNLLAAVAEILQVIENEVLACRLSARVRSRLETVFPRRAISPRAAV
jgi:hypothetical protein